MAIESVATAVPRAAGADRPSAYLPGDRRRAVAAGQALPSRVRGAALFADISGFTPLTEALASELGSQRASETLTGYLNSVFHAVIAELDRYGGDVIYFSGDAITCWLDGDDGSRAVACGLAMQAAMGREAQIVTPGGLSFQLALKVAIAVGEAGRFVVGDPEIQLIDVLAGGLIDRLIEAEHLTREGEVVLDRSAVESLRERVALRELRPIRESGESAAVVERLLVAVPDAPPPTAEALPDELARQWLLPAVYERLSTGRGEFLAELRPAFPVFVNFGGIDYDADESASEKLDEFVRAAQRVLAGFGGNVLQLTLGDKGAHLYGVFGTPLAHEDDAARACAASLELLALEATTAARNIRVGVTHGRLRSGTYGHAERRTFVCLGDAVNLSARLMSRAPSGEIYVSELVRRMAGDGFSFVQLEPLRLKGKAAPVAAYALTGLSERRSRRVVRYTLPIVGRADELAALEASLAASIAGRGSVVGISAEAGMGKSRLLAEFVRKARRRDLLVAYGECQSFGAATGYFVWREIWRVLLGVSEDLAPADQIVALEQALHAIDPALVPRAPVLDALFALSIPDTKLTGSFDAKLRKTSLENLLADCLRAKAEAGPLVLVLEDCHWLDPLSRDLLEVIARAVGSVRALLVLTYRPEVALPQGLGLAKLPHLQELPIEALGEAEMTLLARSKLVELAGDVAEAEGQSLLELVVGRAQGNPFYAEELLNYVRAQEIDFADERALRSLELPGSLHSLILSRIDTLTEAPRRTLKVASVVGRVFRAPMLPGVYPELGAIDDVRAQLGTLRLLDLVKPDREDDESYLFKHAVTQEVAYESLPYALRATLHEHVGRFIEQEEPDEIERNLDLLAHHFWHGDDEAKKRDYLRRAGAAAQASYANASAIDYYERLAGLVPDEERIDVLLELGKVLELVGQWDRARAVDVSALELAEATGDERSRAWCETALAEVARKQGRYDEAADLLARARAAFVALGEEHGLGQALHLEGTLAAQRGSYVEAQARYEESLAIRRRLDERGMTASVLSNLGIVAEYGGDYELARSFHEQALDVRTALGDRRAISNSLTNIGMIAVLEGRYLEARERFEEAMRLDREVGDSWMVAVSHNNLGNATRDLGDYAAAQRHYADSLHGERDYGDRWALAFLIEDVAVLAGLLERPVDALELLGGADRLREECGSPRAPAQQAEIEARLSASLASIDGEEQIAARRRGVALDFDGVIELALDVLSL